MDEYKLTNLRMLNLPELSDWQCYTFGMGKMGICFRPLKGKEPNWFWRKMQYLVFGNKWVKATK